MSLPIRVTRALRHAGTALIVAMAPGGLSAQEEGIKVGTAAPAVSVADLDGREMDLGRYIGKRPMFLEYWATWCSVCAELMPRVRTAHAKFGKDVEFIGINVAVNQSVDRVRRYAATEKPPFRILYDTKGVSARAYGAPTTSYIVIVDRKGKVAYTGVGTDQKFEAALARGAEWSLIVIVHSNCRPPLVSEMMLPCPSLAFPLP
jgi:peroxiredoxin